MKKHFIAAAGLLQSVALIRKEANNVIARTKVSAKFLVAELIRLPADLSTPSATYSYFKPQHLCTKTFPAFCRQRQLQQEETLRNGGGLDESADALSILAQSVVSSHV